MYILQCIALTLAIFSALYYLIIYALPDLLMTARACDETEEFHYD